MTTSISGSRKFLCRYCGYFYDEFKGSPEDGIVPGTRWEDLPEDWFCPQCGTDRTEFDLVDD